MVTKNLANLDWDSYDDDDLYDEFIEEETTKKIRAINKVRDKGSNKNYKKVKSPKNEQYLGEYEYDYDYSDEYSSYIIDNPFKSLLSSDPAPKEDKKQQQKKEIIKNPSPKPKNIAPASNQAPSPQSINKVKVEGINVKEIKNYKIDFDRLTNIEQVQGEYQGHETFGIKFYFKGNKGLFRIIWYGRNIFERDHAFTEYYNFWKSLGY